ncbi:MAG: YicC family protein [Clostridiales bacterium]|nr:YicC family protein [Clostridiales bacterium]
MFSMTGYGRAEYNEDGINLVVEIKTVNNRVFDLNAKTPRSFIMFDDLIRKTVQSYVKRGRIDLFVTFSDKREKQTGLNLDIARAESYYNIGKEIAQKFSVENDLTVTALMKCPDVVTDDAVSDMTEFESILKSTVQKACESLNAMRLIEGEKLVADMLSRMDEISSLRGKIVERAPLVALEHKERLKNRIEEALKDVKIDEARLLNEVAFYVDKVNIDEELTRLDSHIKQFRQIIKGEGAGKKLDFLMQEFNRETNTICSKSNDIQVTGYALSLKNEIEKVREQVQNLE